MPQHQVQWERMFPDELEAAFQTCPIVYLPYGLCEPHGLAQRSRNGCYPSPSMLMSGRPGTQRNCRPSILLALSRHRWI